MDSSLPVPLDASCTVSDEHSEVKPQGSYRSSLKDTWKVERPLGNSELSYFLPSRASGVNDMYLHLGFVAPEHVVRRERVLMVWAILRIRHPLLASNVVMQGYDDVKFVFTPPQSPGDALVNADCNLEYRTSTKDELIDSYLNGARTLSNDRLSYLIVSQGGTSLPSPPITPRSISPFNECESPSYNHDRDGMALHQLANDLFGLLGGDKTIAELEAQLKEELSSRWDADSTRTAVLPNALEDNFTVSPSKLRNAAEKVDFQLSQRRLVGGHSFRRQTKQPRHTIVPTVSFDPERTKSILKRCKTHGVSVSAAIFAACNIAWAKMCSEKQDLSMMMYSALNLRPYFTVKPANDSYWFLAIGYFNVILPTFIPRSIDLSSVFWHRARVAKEQSTQAAKNRMIVSRSLLMAEERGQRARLWAKEDDEKERGTFVPPPPSSVPAADTALRTPSAALIGLSLLGNLDGIYKHGTFPAIKLHTLTTGSRQRSGGMLLFGYTFAGKLWVSLGYDVNGFDKVMVEQFWEHMLQTMDDLLLK
ncbi:uncharacterized protein BJ212DRAFT_1482771 [Suillus subaureus]|uniref:Uncharacterized protein n=1 Tax=Suillus subaureus TaxID=48587 RepID=A0A9P7E7E6_9AGAM|nr:uncharacterized protein BJ212DRAFT_1482771 [Suillus subaureus]KAG1813317.1 hypothetical protein BJ212DRAFT_1482771 [Suillus subaureus]